MLQPLYLRMDDPPVLEQRPGGAGKAASKAQLTAAEKLRSDKWRTIVEMSALGAGYKDTCKTYLVVKDQGPFTHIRLNIFPDGGVARLRLAIYLEYNGSIGGVFTFQSLWSCRAVPARL